MDDSRKEFKVGWRTPESVAECESDLRINRENMIREAKELHRYIWLLRGQESPRTGLAPATEQEFAARDRIVELLKMKLASHAEEMAFIRRDKARIRAALQRVREDSRQLRLQGTSNAYGELMRRLEQEFRDVESVERDHLAAERYVRMALERQRLCPWPGNEKPKKHPTLVLPDVPNPAKERTKRDSSPRRDPSSRQIRELINEGPVWK